MLRIPMQRVYSWDSSKARKHYESVQTSDPQNANPKKQSNG